MKPVPWQAVATAGDARAGVLRLAGTEVRTPTFMPVGTQAAIRTVSPLHLEQTGSQIVLANTYHLSQRPGEDVVKKAGGLHVFSGIKLPMLTDSGGFQVFSLDKKEVTEEGVTFTYEVDGNRTFLSPERSMQIQMDLGADIAMVFDECLPFGADRKYAEASVGRTTRWERRSKAAHTRPDQALFGIIQGGFWGDLRKRSAEEIQEIGFDGYAIGGLSVGEGHKAMCDVLDDTMPYVSKTHGRYLMGVGRPIDLVEGVARGIDMFDCVLPTRHGRSGVVYTTTGRIRVSDAKFRKDMFPIDTDCRCYACVTFTRAYIHHLLRVDEVLGSTLATIHNLHWFATFMDRMRTSIIDGSFESFRRRVHELYPEDTSAKPVAVYTPLGGAGTARVAKGPASTAGPAAVRPPVSGKKRR
ncbi:MAG: tRNA guanosine(34) transglycosylase Tgt [Myxococcales bacterium]|nr:tRNA guanosine(34) transglycosylase Tgt [Myxococcales bacterium]